MIAAAQIVVVLQTIVSRENSPLDPAVVTVGSIHGGKTNTTSSRMKFICTDGQTYKAEVRKNILASIERIAKGVALTVGIPANLAPIVTVGASIAPATLRTIRRRRRMAPC